MRRPAAATSGCAVALPTNFVTPPTNPSVVDNQFASFVVRTLTRYPGGAAEETVGATRNSPDGLRRVEHPGITLLPSELSFLVIFSNGKVASRPY